MDFVQIDKNNQDHYRKMVSMWISYNLELDGKIDRYSDLIKQAEKRIDIQGNRCDMHLELCYDDTALIGFAFYAVDKGGIKNIIDAGYGYIMEFYIMPAFRRNGYGSVALSHVEDTFIGHHVEYVYLTPSKKDGIPFWHNRGYYDSGKTDPDNNMPIYIKNIINTI